MRCGMRTLKEYITKDLGYVSKWWKWALIAFLLADAIVITTLAGCYEGMGEIGEMYFSIKNKTFYIGFME